MKPGLAALLVLSGCSTAPDLERARAELLALHAEQRRVHLEEDAAGFAALLDEGYVELRDGALLRPTRSELEARFREYFAAVEFLAWDDVDVPAIELSRDGTLATVAVTKLVRTRPEGDEHGPIARALFAWLATCNRHAEGWRITQVASTRAPQGAKTSLAALRHALGGAARIRALQGVRARYEARSPQGSPYAIALDLPAQGPWTIAWHYPGQPAAAFELEGHEGWSLAPDGARSALPSSEAEMVRSHAFPWLVLAPESFLPGLESEGPFDEGGRWLERLSTGHGSALVLDLATDLPARLELVDEREGAARTVTVRFEAWRREAGLLVPARVVAVDAKGEWTMELGALELRGAPLEPDPR